jgi:competence protein ComEA
LVKGSEKGWIAVIILLLLVIALGSVLFITRYPTHPPLEIILPSPTPFPPREAYIGGEVNSPGVYPLQPGDSLEELIKAAGGFTQEADLHKIKIYVPKTGETVKPQRININTAQAWLLTALPGIGPKLAEAIVTYRASHGPFRSPQEIIKVPGIGARLYNKIKEFITVGD